MKKFNGFLVSAVFICFCSCDSLPEQEVEVEEVVFDTEVKEVSMDITEKGNEDVFFIVEEMPEFPGGGIALRSFIAKSVKYPAEAKESNISGKVYVNFVIDTDGTVTDVKIARGVNVILDKEALRVVNSLPQWSPGKQKGQAVKVAYTVPINFVLE